MKSSWWCDDTFLNAEDLYKAVSESFSTNFCSRRLMPPSSTPTFHWFSMLWVSSEIIRQSSVILDNAYVVFAAASSTKHVWNRSHFQRTNSWKRCGYNLYWFWFVRQYCDWRCRPSLGRAPCAFKSFSLVSSSHTQEPPLGLRIIWKFNHSDHCLWISHTQN